MQMQMQQIQINSAGTGQLNMRITVDNHRINMLTIFSRIRQDSKDTHRDRYSNELHPKYRQGPPDKGSSL